MDHAHSRGQQPQNEECFTYHLNPSSTHFKLEQNCLSYCQKFIKYQLSTVQERLATEETILLSGLWMNLWEENTKKRMKPHKQ